MFHQQSMANALTGLLLIMKKDIKMNKLLISLLLLSGCATQGVNRADQNEIIKEFYASVSSVQQVKLSSEVKTGMASGAVIGVLDELDGNHEEMIAGGIIGALVGGLFTAIFEGSDTAYQYSLSSAIDGPFSVIQKEKIDTESGCVKVRLGHEVSISSALSDDCVIL